VHALIGHVATSVESLRSQQEDLSRRIPLRAQSDPPPPPPVVAAVPGVAQQYYGVDVSRWNGNFADEIDRIPRLAFAIGKATEGLTLRDDHFQENRTLLRTRGIAHGGYHLFHQDDDPTGQAQFYLDTVGTIADGDIAPVIDVEDASLSKQGPPDPVPLQSNLLSMLRTLEARTGRSPILYTNLEFAQKYLGSAQLSHYRLWLAEYTLDEPRVPDAWRAAGYFIWQKSASYKVGSAEFDLDVFRGSWTELLR